MIRIDTLRASYREDSPLLHIDALEVEEGKITSIIGKNGSGKSTLMKTLVGQLPYEGMISIGGDRLSSLSTKERARRIAYLPQTLPIPQMSVRTLVSHGRYSRLPFSKVLGPGDRDAIERALDLTDMTELAGCMLSKLSGGQRQRAFLAMVIAQDPLYFLLDEVTSYMDIEHQRKTMEIVTRLAESGKGILMTSHDLPLSFTVSDKIYIFEEGHAALQGSPGELLEKKEQVRDILGISIGQSSSAEALYTYELQK